MDAQGFYRTKPSLVNRLVIEAKVLHPVLVRRRSELIAISAHVFSFYWTNSFSNWDSGMHEAFGIFLDFPSAADSSRKDKQEKASSTRASFGCSDFSYFFRTYKHE